MLRNTYHTRLDQFRRKARNFALFIDGTGNDPSDILEEGSGTTNIYRMSQLVDRNDQATLVRYFRGVGNEQQHTMLGQAAGTVFGTGAERLRDEAYVVLVTNYRPGDRIFLFGFSRGAAIVRMLANLIDQEGIPETIKIYKAPFTNRIVRYKNSGKRVRVPIEMLGVFDTVAAFGVPADALGLNFQQTNLFKNMTVAGNVKNAHHLLSVDEDRHAFLPTLVNRSNKVEEVWFAGDHADVGGGHDTRDLSDIGLQFMIDRAGKHGLAFFQPAVDLLEPNPAGKLHRKPEGLGALKRERRVIGVSQNDKIDPTKKPKIHASVFERMRLCDDYDPPNLAALNGNYRVVDE